MAVRILCPYNCDNCFREISKIQFKYHNKLCEDCDKLREQGKISLDAHWRRLRLIEMIVKERSENHEQLNNTSSISMSVVQREREELQELWSKTYEVLDDNMHDKNQKKQ